MPTISLNAARLARRGLRCAFVAGLFSLAGLCTTATAAVIPGDPLQIFMDGSGRLQVRFQGFAAGELRPEYLDLADQRSGLAISVYHRSPGTGGSTTICGSSPIGGFPIPVSAPALTGAGTPASPYEMTTAYDCDTNGLRVTQTFIYVNGNAGFVARYSFSNPGTEPIAFTPVCRGVFSTAGSRLGRGFFDSATPRVVGVFNDAQGSAGGFVEAATTPWTRFMQAALRTDTPYEPMESPIFGEMTNTVDPSLVSDPRAAVQFDRYTSFGLAPGATDSFDVHWYFDRYDGLSLTPSSGSRPVGETQSVTATSLNHGQPVSGGTVRYAITGANPSSGTAATDANGTATIAWNGIEPGQDTLSAFVDSDHDAAFDPATETQQTATFSWTPPPATPPPPPPAQTPPAPAPPPPAQTPAPAPSAPGNDFSLTATARAGGAIRITLTAATAGRYQAIARSRRANRSFAYGKARTTTSHAGRVSLTIKPTLAAKRRLKAARAPVRVTIAITFTATSGSRRTKHIAVAVKRR